MGDIQFILDTVAPVFCIIALGYFLRKVGLITPQFITLSSKIVFSVSLPVLIFLEVSEIDLQEVFDLKVILFVYLGYLILFGLVWLISLPLAREGRDRGVFIQGAFRSNFAIIGLAIIANLFGKEGLASGSLLLGFLVPVFNVLSVVALTVPKHTGRIISWGKIGLEILKNPLIIAVIVALPFSLIHLQLNSLVKTTADYVASIALPLALLGIGGSLRIRDIPSASGLAVTAALLKLIFFPVIFTTAAYLIGIRDVELGVVFILTASPTAIASFIMAEAMDCNGKLAGHIVLISTLGSILTITFGLFLLMSWGLLPA